MSMTDIDNVGKDVSLGCFQSASRHIRKRKHSEMESDQPKLQRKSIFASIREKLGLVRSSADPPKSILSSNGGYRQAPGETNPSYQHDDYFSFDVTNEVEHETHPKKRVKFDEENLIVSSITYQRQQTAAHHMMLESSADHKSMFAKFVNFTANLF